MADVFRISQHAALVLDVLSFSATLAREFWSWAVTARQAGWLLEYKAKLFLHSEWVPAPEADPAA